MRYAPRKVYIKESGGYVELSYTDFCRRRQADQSYMDKLFIPVQLERLSALNALLNMDEKGDDAFGMDDGPEEENGGQETSGHDVQKPAQTEKTSERPETGERAANTPIPYPVENARHDHTIGSGGLRAAAAMADKPAQRVSLKEKLEAFKSKVAGVEKQEKHKEKGKEVTM